ncbi:MAG: hypothetical protein LIR50_21815 [Bacillota bacterium]|nr:hypothetical protein [Bacillota bacterium]
MNKETMISLSVLEDFFQESIKKYKDTGLEDKLISVWMFIDDNLTSFLSNR